LERFGKRLRGCRRSGFQMRFVDGGLGNGLRFGGRSGVACGEGLRNGWGGGVRGNRRKFGQIFRNGDGGGTGDVPGGNAELFHVAGIGFEAGRGSENGRGLFAAVHRRQRSGNRADGRNGGTVGQRGGRNLLRDGLWNGERNGLKRFGKMLRGCRRSGCRSHVRDSRTGNVLRFGSRSRLACGDGLRDGFLGGGKGGLLYGGGVGRRGFVPRGRHGLRNGRGSIVGGRRWGIRGGSVDGAEEVHGRKVRRCSSIRGFPEVRWGGGDGGLCLTAVGFRQGERNGIDGRNGVDGIKRIQRSLLGDGLWNGERNGVEWNGWLGKRLHGNRRIGGRRHSGACGKGGGLRLGGRTGRGFSLGVGMRNSVRDNRRPAFRFRGGFKGGRGLADGHGG
jgi:hypothetical protein